MPIQQTHEQRCSCVCATRRRSRRVTERERTQSEAKRIYGGGDRIRIVLSHAHDLDRSFTVTIYDLERSDPDHFQKDRDPSYGNLQKVVVNY